MSSKQMKKQEQSLTILGSALARAASAATKPSKIQEPGDKPSKQKKRASRRSTALNVRNNNFATQYVATLRDPFHNPPLRLGFGTMVDTSLFSGWTRGVPTIVNTDTWFCLVARPQLQNTVLLYTGTTNVAFSTLTPSATFSCVNTSVLQNLAQVSRVVSSGLSAKVGTSALDLPGHLWKGFQAGDSWDNFQTMNINNLLATEFMVPVHSKTIDISYRPRDTISFEFNANALSQTPTGTSQPIFIVCGTNFTAGKFNLDFDFIVNLETIGGFDLAAADTGKGWIASIADVTRAVRQAGDALSSTFSTARRFYSVYQAASRMANSYGKVAQTLRQVAPPPSRRESSVFIENEEEKGIEDPDPAPLRPLPNPNPPGPVPSPPNRSAGSGPSLIRMFSPR